MITLERQTELITLAHRTTYGNTVDVQIQEPDVPFDVMAQRTEAEISRIESKFNNSNVFEVQCWDEGAAMHFKALGYKVLKSNDGSWWVEDDSWLWDKKEKWRKLIMLITANLKGEKVYSIPVEWVVTENLHVRANDLKEAVKFLVEKLDEIPTHDDAEYIDGTYKISADENNNLDVDEIVKNLNTYGCLEWDAKSYGIRS